MARKDILQEVTQLWLEQINSPEPDPAAPMPYNLANDPNMVMVPPYFNGYLGFRPALLIRVNWREYHVYNTNRAAENHHEVYRSLPKALQGLLEV